MTEADIYQTSDITKLQRHRDWLVSAIKRAGGKPECMGLLLPDSSEIFFSVGMETFHIVLRSTTDL
jgi:hypothetical protein